MDTEHRNPAGGLVAQCSDEAACKKLTCAVCLKEVPADAVKITDAQDYVHHFCGLDCLDAWRKQAEARGRQSG
ncbi:MAG: DUF3330 domain-containing protein [Gammaproteobacteria bacterium]|nr:DUF3330 domain-containing protein [Gammaproteobacteria bacterium]MBU1407640.1 DUF3330 domain-containing protein [Gammaproteobacteria bacterium]MBU1531753.1 DUF3330 domain-containing protein [Gammaproteobacteria bacterium]